MLDVKVLREEGFCVAVRLQDRDTFELSACEASSWKTVLDLLRTKPHG